MNHHLQLDSRLKVRRGFTMVELLGVLVILGLIASVITLSVRAQLLSGRQKTARLDMAALSEALEAFHVETSRYPTEEEGLAILFQKSDKFPQGLMSKRSVNKDPWGQPYDYVLRENDYLIVCYGADHKEGGTGANQDLTSDQLSRQD
jgi:general secretion pathway protein G